MIHRNAYSNATRGVFHGGYDIQLMVVSNNIEFVTIATTGNTVDFGDSLQTDMDCGWMSSPLVVSLVV